MRKNLNYRFFFSFELLSNVISVDEMRRGFIDSVEDEGEGRKREKTLFIVSSDNNVFPRGK